MAGHTTGTECGGDASRRSSLRKQEEPLRGPRRRAKASVEERPKATGTASGAGGLDSPRGCAPVNDLEQDALEGEDTIEDECWTEEDDETLQLGYLGSESCLMSSPPGLSDAFSEAGWTLVTRKLRAAMLQATWVL